MSEEESEIPRPRNEITIRDYERKQLVEYLPRVIEHYESLNVDDENRIDDVLELLESMQTIFSEEIDGIESTYDLGADAWEDLAVGLAQIDDDRSSWLRAKLARRAELKPIQMGFSSSVPVMPMMLGTEPKRPDRV